MAHFSNRIWINSKQGKIIVTLGNPHPRDDPILNMMGSGTSLLDTDASSDADSVSTLSDNSHHPVIIFRFTQMEIYQQS